MPSLDQLEIIWANGQIEFYPLDPGRGITNIGRHPENDIVIDSPGIAPFHAVVDHRQKPYQLVVLSHAGQTILEGQVLPPNITIPFYNWNNLWLDGHTIILLENGSASTLPMPVTRPEISPPPQLIPTVPLMGSFPVPTTWPEQPGGSPPLGSGLPPDLRSDIIVTEMEERERTVQVEQPASYQLTIINGGNVVASFMVGITGLDPSWVTVSAPQVNLYEGQRTSVILTVTPPRVSGSRAGVHPFAIFVTSPNYPGQMSQHGASLQIEPFYDFAVGELSPKRQSISWFKRSGQCTVAITNKGNSEAPFRVDGQDDMRACSFEFTVPGEAVGLARQVDLRVLPEEVIAVPMAITPHSRSLIGLRSRGHNFTVTTTLLEGQQTPRSQLGELRSAPLLGPLHILLLIILLLFLIYRTFRPEVYITASPGSVTAGQQVQLYWNSWPPYFASVKLNDGVATADVDVSGQRTDRLIKTTKYEVTADTWLSRLLVPKGYNEVTIKVTPVRPDIGLFRADPSEISSGQTAILSWFVVGADELKLVNNTDNIEEELKDASGSRPVTLEKSTSFTLKAVNASSPDSPAEQSVAIAVTTPTPEPLTPPVIQSFVVQPQTITAGQTVTLQWAVTGVDSISIAPIGDKLPPVGPPITHSPQETTLYVLTASNGKDTVNAVQQVVVATAPTPTPTPLPGEPPVIEFFGVTPEEATRVEPDRSDNANEVKAQLNWVVTGDATNVELTGGPPGFERLSNLSRIGEATIKVRDTTVFVLTAFNGEAKVVKTAQIKFLDPTPTPESDSGSGGGSGGGGSGGGSTTSKPKIVTFAANGVSPADQVTDAGSSVFQVVAGSNVNLTWDVQNADTVTLVGVGDQPPVGTYTLSNVVTDQTFQLTATGTGGTSQAFLQLRIVAKPAPPPPFSVNGTVAGSNITLTWDHAAENDIIGFRVYRALAVVGPFVRVVDESQLGNGSRQFVDVNALPGCKAYFVTAVYLDPLSGNKLETPASSNSWYGPGC